MQQTVFLCHVPRGRQPLGKLKNDDSPNEVTILISVDGLMLGRSWTEPERPFVKAVCREPEASLGTEPAPQQGLSLRTGFPG